MANANGNGIGPNKFDKAVTRATGGPEVNAPTIPVKNIGDFITKNTDQKIVEAIVNDPGLETAPQLYTMEQGDLIEGWLEGHGPDAEFERTNHGVVETNTVKTWIIASPDRRKRISILSGAQLDRKLPPFVGGPIKIVRGKDLPTNSGQRVTDYLVAGPKMPDGTMRNWATRPVLEAAATEHQRALPEATETHATHAAPAAPAGASA